MVKKYASFVNSKGWDVDILGDMVLTFPDIIAIYHNNGLTRVYMDNGGILTSGSVSLNEIKAFLNETEIPLEEVSFDENESIYTNMNVNYIHSISKGEILLANYGTTIKRKCYE